MLKPTYLGASAPRELFEEISDTVEIIWSDVGVPAGFLLSSMNDLARKWRHIHHFLSNTSTKQRLQRFDTI